MVCVCILFKKYVCVKRIDGPTDGIAAHKRSSTKSSSKNPARSPHCSTPHSRQLKALLQGWFRGPSPDEPSNSPPYKGNGSEDRQTPRRKLWPEVLACKTTSGAAMVVIGAAFVNIGAAMVVVPKVATTRANHIPRGGYLVLELVLAVRGRLRCRRGVRTRPAGGTRRTS